MSIIIACRNEEEFIGKCLDSIIAQDYLHENLEVLVIGGMSEDRTRKIAREYKEYNDRFPFVKLLEIYKKALGK